MARDSSGGAPANLVPSEGSPAVRSPLLLAAIIGVLAVVSTALYTAWGIRYPITGGGETIAITDSLIADGSFANPFAAGKTGASAFLPPFYPMFRAGLVLAFGRFALLAALIITLLVHGLHAAMLPSVSQLMFGRAMPGICAACMAIVLPLFDVVHWEAMYVAAGLVLFYLCAARVYARGGAWRGVGLGIAAGFLLLANPASLLAFAPWLLVLVWRRRREGTAWRKTACMVVAVCLTCAPWTIRNYRQFGRLVFIRDNLGLALYAANNDCAEASALEDMRKGCTKVFNPMYSVSEVRLIRRLGEVEYNRYRAKTAYAWIERNPGRFVGLTVRRVLEFWFPLEAYSFWIVTALAIPGTILLLRRHRTPAWVMLTACALFTLLYAVTEVTPRYRYPIVWMTLLEAGYFADLLLARARTGRVSAESKAA